MNTTVELHKTVMAYHFALNSMIAKPKAAQRLPFLLDAILKEDIDETNLETILFFVSKNLPSDTQTFFLYLNILKTISLKKMERLNPSKKLACKKFKKFTSRLTQSCSILVMERWSVASFLSLERFQELHEDTVDIIAV